MRRTERRRDRRPVDAGRSNDPESNGNDAPSSRSDPAPAPGLLCPAPGAPYHDRAICRQAALIDARLTVQRWRAMPAYTRYRVLWHVARALGVPPFLAGSGSRNCAAADLRGERGQRRLSAEMTKPALEGRGLCHIRRSGKFRPINRTIRQIAGLCKPLLEAALKLRPDAAPRAPSIGG